MSKEPIFSDEIEAEEKEVARLREAEKRKTVADIKATFSTEPGGNIFLKLVHDMYLFRPYKQQNAGAYAKEGKREYIIELMDTVGHEEFLKLYFEAVNRERGRQERIDE